jgi:hypothetical protein
MSKGGGTGSPSMLRNGAGATRSALPDLLGVEGGNVEVGQRLRVARGRPAPPGGHPL